MKISDSVQCFNVMTRVIEMNDGIVPGGFDYVYSELRREVGAIQQAAGKRDVNEFLKDISDKRSQVVAKLSAKDLPGKCPAGMADALSPILDSGEYKKDYYSALVKKDK